MGDIAFDMQLSFPALDGSVTRVSTSPVNNVHLMRQP
jgi:hypothetical protein